MRVRRPKLSEKRYAPSSDWAMAVGLLTLRTVSSSSIAVLTRA